MAKKVTQLTLDPNLTKDRLLFSGDKDTGKLYRVTYDMLKEFVLAPLKLQFNSNSTYLVPAGYTIDKIIITPQSTSDIKIGSSAGSDDVMLETNITGGSDYPLRTDVVAKTNKTIYFSGIISTTDITIYLQKY